MYPTYLSITEAEQRQCDFLSGLRAMVRFLEMHPEVMGDHPGVKMHFHHDDPAAFLTAERELGGIRQAVGQHYSFSARKFSRNAEIVVQTWRETLEATPKRIAETIDPEVA